MQLVLKVNPAMNPLKDHPGHLLALQPLFDRWTVGRVFLQVGSNLLYDPRITRPCYAGLTPRHYFGFL